MMDGNIERCTIEVRPSYVVRHSISQAHASHSIRHVRLTSFLQDGLPLFINDNTAEHPWENLTFSFDLLSTIMKLTLALLALSQVSHALHIVRESRTTGSRQLKRTAQDATLNDSTDASSTDASNTRKSKKPLPWWKLPNTENGEMNAISWTQFYPLDNEDGSSSSDTDTGITAGNSVCPVNQCQSSGVLGKYYCGENARCLSSYCQCNLGWKPASGVPMSRGWTGLEALTVWVDAYSSGCTERCDNLSCSEVPQVQGCFDQHVTHSDNNKGKDQGQEDQQDLATDNLHLGAIKAPGADAGIGV
jgi:hypothetical protein